MPALSQSLIFKIPNDNTTYDSVSVQYPNSGQGPLVYLSDQIKGNGYFGNGDGIHTVFWSVADFIGTIDIEGTLAVAPGENDWTRVKLTEHKGRFYIDTTGLVTDAVDSNSYTSPTTIIKSYNFTGNFVWLRGRISEFEQGTMNGISINR